MILYKTNIFVICLFLTLCHLCSSQAFRTKPSPTPYHDWDYLMFSQRWPITSCTQWEEAKKDNTCNLPADRNLWTIHGVWPTKLGKEGPLFCPSAIHFNPEELQPMMDRLKVYWINVEANTKPNSFWAHEWNKHGTCASVLPIMDSVTNYFEIALELNRQYDLSKMLSNSGILPNAKGYNVSDIYSAIKTNLKKNPMIQCVVDRKTKDSMLSEIRICLNKSLELIDCDPTNPVHRKLNAITNCSIKKPVMYLSTLPSASSIYEMDYVDEALIDFQKHYEQQQNYMSIYRFLKFLMWFTV